MAEKRVMPLATAAKISKTMEGNQNRVAIRKDEPEIRQEAFKQYCDHLASGQPKQSFFFEHPTHSICWKTMEKYIDDNPSEFPTLLIEGAKSKRYQHWLKEGETIMKGGYKNGSPVVWQTFMRNIFKDIGWDRREDAQSDELMAESKSILNQMSHAIETGIKLAQQPSKPVKDQSE